MENYVTMKFAFLGFFFFVFNIGKQAAAVTTATAAAMMCFGSGNRKFLGTTHDKLIQVVKEE